MKILVVSDTHKRMDRVFELIRENKDFTSVIHLGDNYEDALEIREKFDLEVFAVKGNCDANIDADEIKVINTTAGNILLTHGHRENVNYSLNNLYYKSMENNCNLACFGHTHIPMIQESEEIKFLNPGSISRPANNSNGNYGIILVEDNKFVIEIFEYKKAIKRTGGYIKNLMNNSDRF